MSESYDLAGDYETFSSEGWRSWRRAASQCSDGRGVLGFRVTASWNARAGWPNGTDLLCPLPPQKDAQPLCSPLAAASSWDSHFIQTSRDLVQFQTVGAHASDLAQDFLFIGQRHQQPPPIVVDLVAELVAIGSGAEAHPLRHDVSQRVTGSLGSYLALELVVVGEVHQDHAPRC